MLTAQSKRTEEERTLDRLKELPGHVQTGVGTVRSLGSESHGGAVATTRASLLVVGTARVPRKSNKDRAIAAIVVIGLLSQKSRNLVVDLLVVLLGGNEGAAGLGGDVSAVEVEVGANTTGGSETNTPDQGVGRLARAGLRGISPARRGTEGLGRQGKAGVASNGSEGGGGGGRAGKGPGEGACSRGHCDL